MENKPNTSNTNVKKPNQQNTLSGQKNTDRDQKNNQNDTQRNDMPPIMADDRSTRPQSQNQDLQNKPPKRTNEDSDSDAQNEEDTEDENAEKNHPSNNIRARSGSVHQNAGQSSSKGTENDYKDK